MKKLILSIVGMILMVSLVACSPKVEDIDFDVEAIGSQMMEAAWGEGMSFPFELTQFVESYELDPELVSEFYGNGGSMIDANRIMIFEVKDAKDIDVVKAIALKEQENLIAVFEEYLPGPRVVANDSEVIIKGRYVLFVSHENKAKVIEIFEAQFTK